MKYFALITLLFAFSSYGSLHLYDSARVSFTCGFTLEACQYSVSAEFESPRVELQSSFLTKDRRSGESKKCQFTTRLNRGQSRRLVRLANRLRTCTAPGSEVQDASEDVIYLGLMNGNTIKANKRQFGYPSKEIYLCAGARAYYDYLHKLLRNRVPASCPKGWEGKLFSF